MTLSRHRTNERYPFTPYGEAQLLYRFDIVSLRASPPPAPASMRNKGRRVFRGFVQPSSLHPPAGLSVERNTIIVLLGTSGYAIRKMLQTSLVTRDNVLYKQNGVLPALGCQDSRCKVFRRILCIAAVRDECTTMDWLVVGCVKKNRRLESHTCRLKR